MRATRCVISYVVPLAGLVVVLLAGCRTAPTSVPAEDLPGPLPAVLAGFAAEPVSDGEPAYNVTADCYESVYGCTVAFEHYVPEAGPAGGLAVLAHGFMRDLESMRDWAKLWASHGVQTVVVSFCNSGWFDGHHDRNAADLLAIAGRLAAAGDPVLYAGFSAGGLSALLAAAQDTRAVAYLGLDPVDSGGLATSIDRLAVPGLYLFGEDSRCNAESNMLRVMPAGPRIALRIPYAAHCSFEHPSDEACRRLCGYVDEPGGSTVRQTIRGLATGWVVAQLSVDPDAGLPFTSVALEELAERSRITVLVNE